MNMDHIAVQKLAKDTLLHLKRTLHAGMHLREIRQICEAYMLAHGADSFWYYDIGAFVFSGEDTTISVSGLEYETPDRMLAENDILTVDLSPQCGNIWGDYARTVIMQDGIVCDDIAEIRNAEWRHGLLAEEMLHRALPAAAVPEMTFDALSRRMNRMIADAGFVNLDFRGNLGHSIAADRDSRIYLEAGNMQPLGAVRYFTFEPHIALTGSKFGFKHENIYYFADGTLHEL